MIYRVVYRSMTAFYGPSFIEAEDEFQAMQIFARRGDFQMGCVEARKVSSEEIRKTLNSQD